ncbi:hypothetical protein RCH22_001538 [Cryobacterium psychrotolerans]|nr:hypothetical protein [Cryobacterium psychrotolerans]
MCLAKEQYPAGRYGEQAPTTWGKQNMATVNRTLLALGSALVPAAGQTRCSFAGGDLTTPPLAYARSERPDWPVSL